MNGHVLQLRLAAKRRSTAEPSNACTRTGTAHSPAHIPCASGISLIGHPRREAPLRVQRVPARTKSLPFFSIQYRPPFVERAAVVLGVTGLLIVGAARLAGAL